MNVGEFAQVSVFADRTSVGVAPQRTFPILIQRLLVHESRTSLTLSEFLIA